MHGGGSVAAPPSAKRAAQPVSSFIATRSMNICAMHLNREINREQIMNIIPLE
jgi:hypothetical protein